ncbi:MAG: hypothetical protein RLZZ592_2247 [Pseudomonadota bacterium]|jgi:hypothetical protein|nr:hypothetical protein [Pseudomonadota bacterium]
MMKRQMGWLALALVLAGCAGPRGGMTLPPPLAARAVVLQPGEPGYDRARIDAAVKAPGQGGVSEGVVIRLAEDLPVWRLWNGPGRVDARGHTNRLGGWWSHDAPRGTVQAYRAAYEICLGWNELRWVARCTLKAGTVVVVGPGQSVSPQTCGDGSGLERYEANARDWQLYLDQPWSRGSELVCPEESADYEADPDELSRPKRTS